MRFDGCRSPNPRMYPTIDMTARDLIQNEEFESLILYYLEGIVMQDFTLCSWFFGQTILPRMEIAAIGSWPSHRPVCVQGRVQTLPLFA